MSQLNEGSTTIEEYVPKRALVDPKTDATKRAFRTFLQGLGFDILASLTLLLLPIVSSATGFGSFDWMVILFLVVKTVVVTLFSYIMRYFSISKSTLS